MKILAKILLGLLTLVLLVLGAAYTVWMKPELILTDARVNQLFDQYAGEYFSKRPENLKLKLDPYGFFGKRVSLEASAFCLKQPEACFKQVKVGFAFKILSLKKARIEEIGPILVLNEFVHYQVPVAKAPEPEKEPSTFKLSDHLEIPTNLLLKDLQLDFPEVKILDGKNDIRGKMNATGKESDKMDITAEASSNQGLEGTLGLHTAFVLNQLNPFQAKLHFKSTGSIDGNLDGKVDWGKLQGSVEGELAVRKFVPLLHTIFVRNLKISRDQTVKLSANIETRIEQELSFDHSKSVMPRVSLGANIKGKIEATEDQGVAKYNLEIGPVKEKGLELQANASGEYPFPKGQEYKYGIDKFFMDFEIPVFQTLVQNLKRTNYAIPAPFSALKGNVLLKAGNTDGSLANDTIPLSFVTNLDSTEQTLKTESKAELTFFPPPKKLKISGGTLIQSIRITLPDLKVLEPAPLVKNDSRLISPVKAKKEEAKRIQEENGKEKPSSIDLSWKITSNPTAIRVYHPILKPYAPLEANWQLGNEQSGGIEMKPFEIEYLNRGAKVETLKFFQKPGDPKFYYEGKLVIAKTDYTIFVNIIQDGEKPKVVLTSNPPLEQGDIISVLLFNQTSTELDTDQTSSVASTQSAVTNRALGLFSILALSSTPVEAVNFNPATGIYSARVKLANGLTATVGSDWEKTQEVALRKRLGKNFVLSTILQSDPETNSESRKAIIEWFKRF